MRNFARLLFGAIYGGCAGLLAGAILSCPPALYVADFQLVGAPGDPNLAKVRLVQYTGLILGTLTGAGIGTFRANRNAGRAHVRSTHGESPT